MEFRIKDKIKFGRPNGEMTLGIVEKVNRKTIKVRALEPRGKVPVGGIWRVGPNLCTLLERDGKPAPPTKPPGKTSSTQHKFDPAQVNSALAKLTAHEMASIVAWVRADLPKI